MAEWVKWLLMLVLVGLVTSFPSFPNPYDESEYEKLVEMMEVMAARVSVLKVLHQNFKMVMEPFCIFYLFYTYVCTIYCGVPDQPCLSKIYVILVSIMLTLVNQSV